MLAACELRSDFGTASAQCTLSQMAAKWGRVIGWDVVVDVVSQDGSTVD